MEGLELATTDELIAELTKRCKHMVLIRMVDTVKLKPGQDCFYIDTEDGLTISLGMVERAALCFRGAIMTIPAIGEEEGET